MLRTEFWQNPIVLREMTWEEKYFYVYLLTNACTTQIGIYPITKKEMAFDLGFSLESVHLLMERFEKHYQLIRYNSKTREIAIKNWGIEILQECETPVMDGIGSELKGVEDSSLILFVLESIQIDEI
ncbi:MAG: hypothetical protein ACO1OT_01230 [Heyndrickxia sp.]